MITAFRRVLCRVTPLEVSTRELAESELSRLAHETAQEFSTAMIDYHTSRIDRLREFIKVENSKGSL